MYLLSTRAFGELMVRDPGRSIARWVQENRPQELYVSVISLGAVAAAIETHPDRNPMRRLLAEAKHTFVEQGTVLPVGLEVSEEWANLTVMDLQVQQDDEWTPLGEDDRLVIATAIAHDLTYVSDHEPFLDEIASRTTLKLQSISG